MGTLPVNKADTYSDITTEGLSTNETHSLSQSVDGLDASAKKLFAEEVSNVEINNFNKGFLDRYSSKQVRGAEEFNRAEYVKEKIKLEGMSELVESEVRNLMAGLCAKETFFDAARVSSAQAKGVWQITPETWKHFGGIPGKETSLVAQTEVAGRILSDYYRQLNERIETDSLDKIRKNFASEDAFQVDFIVPALINAYHTGINRMIKVIEEFAKSTPVTDIPTGKDAFVAVSNFGQANITGYGQQSGSYTGKVYAYADEMIDLHEDKKSEIN
ncbi:transglycosylase SLT domain-containing protein [Candidatus Kaiserbacteria bacterium]|nr:transglycosylase SLT domain-containing protein [Candidatus Kaiserbacteria bacterium]